MLSDNVYLDSWWSHFSGVIQSCLQACSWLSHCHCRGKYWNAVTVFSCSGQS